MKWRNHPASSSSPSKLSMLGSGGWEMTAKFLLWLDGPETHKKVVKECFFNGTKLDRVRIFKETISFCFVWKPHTAQRQTNTSSFRHLGSCGRKRAQDWRTLWLGRVTKLPKSWSRLSEYAGNHWNDVEDESVEVCRGPCLSWRLAFVPFRAPLPRSASRLLPGHHGRHLPACSGAGWEGVQPAVHFPWRSPHHPYPQAYWPG